MSLESLYVARMRSVTFWVPGLAAGSQMYCPWYVGRGSTSAGRPDGTAGGGGRGTSSLAFWSFLSFLASAFCWAAAPASPRMGAPEGPSETEGSGTWSASPMGDEAAGWAMSRKPATSATQAPRTVARTRVTGPLGSAPEGPPRARTPSKVAPADPGTSFVTRVSPECPQIVTLAPSRGPARGLRHVCPRQPPSRR